MCRHLQCKWKFPICAKSYFLKRYRLSINNNTNNGHEKLTFELLFRVFQETPSAV